MGLSHFHEYAEELELWTTVILNMWIISSGISYLFLPRSQRNEATPPEEILFALYQGAFIALAATFWGYTTFLQAHNYPKPSNDLVIGFMWVPLLGLAAIVGYGYVRETNALDREIQSRYQRSIEHQSEKPAREPAQ